MSGPSKQPEMVAIGAVQRNAATRVEILIEKDRECGSIVLQPGISAWLHDKALQRERARGPIRLRLEKLDELLELLQHARNEAVKRGWLA